MQKIFYIQMSIHCYLHGRLLGAGGNIKRYILGEMMKASVAEGGVHRRWHRQTTMRHYDN
jgi:hypothetical protein